MKLLLSFISLIIFIISNISCQLGISDIFNIIYNKMMSLASGGTIYFAKDGKCSKDDSTPIFCLINKSLNKIENNNYSFILDINDFNPDYYYELNIFNNTGANNASCLITYIRENKEIKILYYLINGMNEVQIKGEFSFNKTSFNQNNNIINCQKEMDSQLVCYYFDKDKNIQTVIYNIKTCSFSYIYDIDKALKYDNLKNIPNLENTFIIISILKSQVKYFICLNTNFQNTLKMYTKRNFPPNYTNRRLWSGWQSNNNNDNITEFIFTCPNEESLMIFSIFKKDGCLNSLNSNANNGAGIYSFINTFCDVTTTAGSYSFANIVHIF